MPKHLTQNQVTQYRESGYCAPIDIMSEDEALALAEKLKQAEEQYPEILKGRNRNNAHLIFTFMDQIAFNSTILDIVEDLIGPNILLYGSVLFIKEPETQDYVSWHQDATYMGLEPHTFVTPWLALSPSNRHSGCMSVIPGSHHSRIREHQDTFETNNILTRGQNILDVDESKAKNLVLRPGQASCHHPRIIHGSRPNKSKHRRIGVALQVYISPQVRQINGKSFAILARGEDRFNYHHKLSRPVSDLTPEDVLVRDRVNEEWSKILYDGAEKSRNF